MRQILGGDFKPIGQETGKESRLARVDAHCTGSEQEEMSGVDEKEDGEKIRP